MRSILSIVCGLLALGLGSTGAIAQEMALPVTHQHFNFLEGPLTQHPDAPLNLGGFRNPPSPICSTTTSVGSNVDTDCEGNAPHNETTIAVNPTNPLNRIASANDYQLTLTSGGTLQETAFSRAHVTFDGGKTWTTFPIPFTAYDFTGDPAVSFDANGIAYISTLGFNLSQGLGCCTNPDVVVSHSTDGGQTWSTPTRVAAGTGSFGSPGIFNDKPFLAAWGDGNAIVTYTQFNQGIGGSYISSPIFAAVTHDGGNTWSAPVEISGAAPFCIGSAGGTACDQDQGSVPAVAADESIHVAFISTADLKTGRDQYLVVKLDSTSGSRTAGPFKVGGVFDGFTDYPINIDGRQTYQDSEFRTWALGNVATDPTNAAHLAVVWSDMRNSTLPAPSDPYSAKTNSDIIVSQSFDGGQTWSASAAIASRGDQFMPWGAYDSTGALRIGYFDRSYDSTNHKYGFTIATEKNPGTLKFSLTALANTLSDPTKDDRWFSGTTVDTSFPHPTTFLGDYSGITTFSAGVTGLWTDMRLQTCFGTRCGSTEDAFYGTTP